MNPYIIVSNDRNVLAESIPSYMVDDLPSRTLNEIVRNSKESHIILNEEQLKAIIVEIINSMNNEPKLAALIGGEVSIDQSIIRSFIYDVSIYTFIHLFIPNKS